MSTTLEYEAEFGQPVKDRKSGAVGKVTHFAASDDGRRGVWITGLDSTGRPFDLYVAVEDITTTTKEAAP